MGGEKASRGGGGGGVGGRRVPRRSLPKNKKQRSLPGRAGSARRGRLRAGPRRRAVPAALRPPSLLSAAPSRYPGRARAGRAGRGGPCVLDRWLVTLIALGRLIDTTGVKRTLEITNKRANYRAGLERASLKIYPSHI